MNRETIDVTAAAAGSKAAYGGATTTIGSWLLSSEFGVVVGILIGIAGLLTNLYFQHRRDQREEREHQKRMTQLATKPGELR